MANVENKDLIRAYRDAYIDGVTKSLENVDPSALGHIAARAERIEASRNGTDPAKVAPVPCDARAAAKAIDLWRKNGKTGGAWKLTKVVKADTASAVQYADRPWVTGSLVKIKIAASSRDTRRQAQTRAAIAGFDARADRLSKMRAKMRANQPGGEVWKTCTSRAQKEACKSRAKAIAKKIERGQY